MLAPSSDTTRQSTDGVAVMTRHGARGLEFPLVIIAGCEEGLLPLEFALGPNEIEEERRLAYVGLTRAEHRLYLTRAESRSSWGPPTYNPPSRFLDEIPPSVIDWRNNAVFSESPRRYASATAPAASPIATKNGN